MEDGRRRAVIEAVTPQVDGGEFPAKRVLGDRVRVEADIFADGHDSLSAVLLYAGPNGGKWQEKPMQPGPNDHWTGEFAVTQLGLYRFTIHAWVDHFETWRRDLRKRINADTDAAVDYQIGAKLVESAAGRARSADAAWLQQEAVFLASNRSPLEKRARATDDALHQIMLRYPDRTLATKFARELQIQVDPVRARFSAWYELFPRSTSHLPGQYGTFADCEARLEYVARMGFDVLYLPPIHPIGAQFRKGRNNTTEIQPGDVGSPWAIGSCEGGHKGIHPQLGTLADFKRLVARAADLGIQVALDVAFQASPDHPYVREHPEWFRKRPDGSIQYAENPPKKYQDIYPFDFESVNWRDLWKELKSIFTFWMEQGVRIFRVDNPHTKPFAFWQWVIAEIKREAPDVLFLSEAFTRPKIMYRLAKAGFSQSYTYFPWRNNKHELTEYLTELTQTPVREFFRPNQWTNTPDILTEFLQGGTPAAFMIRLLLAATLGANYGIYGPAFELLESRPLRPGSEEYLDSEKYEIRSWDWDREDSLAGLIGLVNRIRRENRALQTDWTLRFHPVDNEQLLCYSKASEDTGNVLLMVVNLDPYHTQAGFVHLPLEQLHLEPSQPFQAHDLLTGARYLWQGPRNYVELNPASVPAHIFRIRHRLRRENDFEYFL